jgi:8-amino-7-oxononanoate synthase
LTTGAPAALKRPPGSKVAARRLAKLIGCNRGILGTSTLHLFVDLFTILSKDRVALFVDDGIYPIAQWAMEMAAARRTPVKFFKHHDPDDLQRLLRLNKLNGRRPVAVSDGLCPGCGRTAPIREYLESIRRFGGLLILDDTQAFGILGKTTTSAMPFGFGGGGSLQWSGTMGSDIVVVNSLAKGFGVPVAVLAGGKGFVKRFERESNTRVHCSPPSAAAIHAANHALEVNEMQGDELRQRLKRLVSRFRTRLKSEGLKAGRTLFPVQGLAPIPGLDVHEVYERLLKSNLHTVLKRAHIGTDAQIALLITTDHSPALIDKAAAVLSKTVHSVMRS